MAEDDGAKQTVQKSGPEVEALKLENQRTGGANWFFWIAGLSLVNSIIIHAGGEWSFIIGLGITQVIDGVAGAFALEMGSEAGMIAKGVAIVGDLLVAGGFVLFGVLAHKRQHWAIVVGMVLYALDGLIFLLVGDWLSIAFHVFALIGMVGGLTASRKLSAIQHPPEPTPAYEPITP